MAVTQIADIISTIEFNQLAVNRSLEKSVLWASGAAQVTQELNRLCSLNFGQTFEYGYWNDLADTEAHISSDDCAQTHPCDKLTSAKLNVIKSMRNMCWTVADITYALSRMGDPMTTIANLVGDYWARQYDRYSLAVVKGILADDAANDASDMIHTVATSGPISFDELLAAKYTMGDRADALTIVVAHSHAAQKLLKDQVANKVFDDSGNLLYFDLIGMRLYVTDTAPLDTGVYSTYLFAPGFLHWGFGRPKHPEEIDRNAGGGNGEGCESLYSRRHFAIHPVGYSWTDAASAGVSPTIAEFETATNWNRVLPRKAVPFAALKHA